MSPGWADSLPAWLPAASAASLGLVRGLGHYLRCRRIARFGDPGILQIRTGVLHRVVSVVLIAAAGWAAAFLMLAPRPRPSRSDPPVVLFCVDPEALRSEGPSLESMGMRALQLMDAVRTTGRQLQGVRIGALVPTIGGPVFLGASADIDGMAARIRSLWPEMVARSGTSQSVPDPWYRTHPEASRAGRALCLITFRSVEEIPRPESISGSPPVSFVLHLADEYGAMGCFVPAQSGGWAESRSLASFCAGLRAAAAPPPEPAEDQHRRIVASIAFAALVLECLLAAAAGRPRRRLPAPALVAAAVWIMGCPVAAMARGHRQVTELAPGIAVITDVSEVQPWVGDQFSIVYHLRIRVPVSAVDVDPQSFTGLWTHSVAAPEGGESGHGTSGEFLLRQLVAWPLQDGPIQIPPLRVRIQTGGSGSSSLQASAEPVTVVARKVTPPGARSTDFPMVGNLAGRLRPYAEGSGSWVLELEGSALIALFDPQASLDSSFGTHVTLSPAESDDSSRQVLEGNLRLVSVVQRRKWLVSDASGLRFVPARAPSIPLFRMPEGRWTQAEITLDEGNPEARDSNAKDRPQTPASQGTSTAPLVTRGRVAALAGGAALLTLVPFVIRAAARRRRSAPRVPRPRD